jgi:phage host-nuclease inhibitor protein Gam
LKDLIMRLTFLAVGLTITLALATGATAQQPATQSEEVGDQSRVICRTETQIGSRLSKIRRCHTAAEWAEVKRENRRVIERVQAMKPAQGG